MVRSTWKTRLVTRPALVITTTITAWGCSESTSMCRMAVAVTDGVETMASSSVARDSASAVSSRAPSISLRTVVWSSGRAGVSWRSLTTASA